MQYLSVMTKLFLYTVSQKNYATEFLMQLYQTVTIFKILSLVYSPGNLQKVTTKYHTSPQMCRYTAVRNN